MEVQNTFKKYIFLKKVKQICIFLLPFFFGFSVLQIAFNTSMPIAIAKGRSMQPIINEGDMLLFKGIPPEEMKIGDIIFFKVPPEMRDILPEQITHRIIEINHDSDGIYFRTQGDNAPPDTYLVRSDDIFGKNVAIIPYLGLLLIYVQTPLGIGVVSALIIINDYGRRSR